MRNKVVLLGIYSMVMDNDGTRDKVWRYLEFGDRRGRWKKDRRALLTRTLEEDGQWWNGVARYGLTARWLSRPSDESSRWREIPS